MNRWIAALDDADFARREAAVKELEKRLHAAVPALRRALAKPSSLEQQRRLERLLGQADQLHERVARVASVLAHLGTPEAGQLLAQWAESDPDGPLGRAASLVRGSSKQR